MTQDADRSDHAPEGGARITEMARRAIPGSLRGRLTTAYTVVAGLLLTAIAVVFVLQLRNALVAAVDRGQADRASASVAALEEASAPDFPDAPNVTSAETEKLTAVFTPSGEAATPLPTGFRFDSLTDAQRTQARHGPIHGDMVLHQQRFRFYAVPVHRPDGTWIVVTAESYRTTDQTIAAVRRALLVGIPLLIALSGCGAWILTGRSLRGVRRMRLEAAELAKANADGQISEPPTRELAELAQTFNRLLDRLYQSVHHQRALVADASHELRTPLTVLRTELELADVGDPTREQLLDSVEHARHEVDRLTTLANDLLFLAHADQGDAIFRVAPLRIDRLVADSVRAYDAQLSLSQVELRQRVPGDLTVFADHDALRRIVDNLLANAVRFTPGGGVIDVTASRDADTAVMTVTDSGAGFPSEFLPHAFERFRKADVARGGPEQAGSGLGLAIVREVVAAHGGTVAATNSAEGGARVTIRLPLRPIGEERTSSRR